MGTASSQFPPVTIIMPVRNEAAYIQRSLSAVLSQDYPPELIDVIIADGMSTDGTRQRIASLIDSSTPFPVILIDNPGLIVPTGFNAALRRASGDIVIRVDGHCLVAPDYVRRCVTHLLEDDVCAVGGPIETVGETHTARVIATAMSSPFGVGGSAFRIMPTQTVPSQESGACTMLVDTVAFPAYTRQAIKLAGFFDEELVRNQDDEYNYRLRKLGGRILLATDIRSKYYSRASLATLWRQYFQYGFWKVRVLQKHPRQMSPRQFVPPVFVASLLISMLLALFIPAGRALLAAFVAVYLFANLLASLWMASKRGWHSLPLLPLVYLILHLSYGLGFLAGLVRFANRWGDRQGQVPPWAEGSAPTNATD